ncbi:acyl-CoA thioesterase [Pseudomonas aeruginosa]|jgi:acyl-CoA thioesterase FadM|nr:acyl-CoA thioesterase [Pseudomonas aeruginosa]MCS9139092.1 acyl-CoA thioesterase [Pseudomonas aeruginosa]MCS9211927.1 acyl-CoA thioesterase [Pseudomonas aeruginosa]
MNESAEIVVAHQPFTVRRVVRWMDCDPAGVVFTGRFTEYLIGAVMHFYRHMGWGPGAQETVSVGLPCKHMALTFHVSLPPDTSVDIKIRVGAIRERSFDLLAHAYLDDGRLAFEGVFAPICIEPQSRSGVPIPQLLRESLQRHLTDEGARP